MVIDFVPSVVVFNANQIQDLFLFEQMENLPFQPIRILVAEELSFELVKAGVNRTHVHKISSKSHFLKNQKTILSEALAKHQKSLDRAFLLKESTRQFRELEALNSDLETIVQERTQHIELSKVDEDEKQNKVRSLIKLIKELAQTVAFEDLLFLVRKELRRFHKIGDPILVYQTRPERVEFISLQGGQISFSHFNGTFPFSEQIQTYSARGSQDLIKVLANHFGRPFIKTMFIPLAPKMMREISYPGAQAGICLEVSFSENELAVFLDFIRERLQSIAITVDRLLLESELVQFSYRWEKTFDGFKDPIAIVDFEFEILRANKKFSERNQRRKCFDVFAGKSESCAGCPVGKAIESGKPSVGEIKVLENGHLKTYEVHSFPILLDHDAKITNVVNQYVEVTQSRDLYLRMLQSEKMEAIGLLAGNIAHELNNPLTGLRSLAQVLIQSTQSNQSLNSDLQEIERAAARSQQIIKNLLEFSVGVPQKQGRFSIDEIVQKTMPMLKTVMRIHRQEFEFKGKDAFIEVEPHMIQQVVFNLVNNACQAMKDPGILILKTYRDKGRVYLEIGDSGPGIPAEIRDKIFEAFFTTKKEGVGTGLGLSLAKKVVEGFGGTISLKSEIGQGAHFTISFPEAN